MSEEGKGRLKVAFTVGTFGFQSEGEPQDVLAAQDVYLSWLRERADVIAQMVALSRPTGVAQ